MFCNKCGNRLEDNSVSCDKCGYVFVYNAVGNPMINKTVEVKTNNNKKFLCGFLLGAGLSLAITGVVLKVKKNASSDDKKTVTTEASADITTQDLAVDGTDTNGNDETLNSEVASSEIISTENVNSESEDTENITTSDTTEQPDQEITEEATAEEVTESTTEVTNAGAFLETLKSCGDENTANGIYNILKHGAGFADEDMKFLTMASTDKYVISLCGITFMVDADGGIKKIFSQDGNYIIFENGQIIDKKGDIVQ